MLAMVSPANLTVRVYLRQHHLVDGAAQSLKIL